MGLTAFSETSSVYSLRTPSKNPKTKKKKQKQYSFHGENLKLKINNFPRTVIGVLQLLTVCGVQQLKGNVCD
jgi:hypothetical protein